MKLENMIVRLFISEYQSLLSFSLLDKKQSQIEGKGRVKIQKDKQIEKKTYFMISWP